MEPAPHPPVFRAVPSRAPPSIDDLVGSWWTALQAGEGAVHAAGRYLTGEEVSRRSQQLRDEQRDAMRVLAELARDGHSESRLLRLLGAPALRRSMIGLPEHVTACVFELDGVLTTSAAVHAAAWAETFDPFLLGRAEHHRRPFVPFLRDHDYDEHLAGAPRLDGVRAFLASRGISLPEGSDSDPPGTATVRGLANRKNEALQQHLERGGVDAFAGARSYLVAAGMLHVRRAVVSASANTETMLERAGLDDLVDELVDGRVIEAEHLRPRPAPDSLLLACRRLGATPHQTAAFETTPAGVAAARAADVGLAVAVGHEPVVAAEADLVVNDLAELLDRSSP
jgi:HAD superfamily hydrolase (TIGR01509 family)